MSEHRREPAGSIDPERGPRRLWDVVEKSPNAPESRSSGPKSELEFILDSTPDGVITIDGRGLVTSANSAAGQLLGHSPATLIGRPFHQLIARPDSIEHLAAQLMRDGDVRSAEFELLLAGGRRRWVSMSTRTRPLPTGTHSPDLTTLVFLRDVSDRHEAQEALEKKNDELEACVRGVSHDLRSPLVSILGFTRLLRDDYQDILSRTGLHFLERIEQAGRNMERLLHDLLELSRIGETSDCRVPVNPWPILDQLASELKLQLDEKGIALQLPEDVPTVLCDRTRLYQIFSNLIGNAVQHMDSKSGGLVRVEVDESDAGWQISVRDNGPGIAPSDRVRIFEAFQTASGPTRGTEGSGLGLAIVKKIVDRFSGRIWVESELGVGSRFVVWLPRD